MRKKVLHIELPNIRYNQDYAFPSAVLASDVSYRNWYLSNMIQLYCFLKYDKFEFSYFYLGLDQNPIKYMPFFDRQMVEMNFIKKSYGSIVDFVIAMIDMDYYCFMILNEYYIPGKDTYMTQNFEHGVMVYGYDLDNKKIYISGYNKSKNFGFDIISFSEFESSFVHTKRNENIICFRRNLFVYDLDVSLMKGLLKDFIDSTNTSLEYRMIQNPMDNCIWGIEACRCIMDDSSNTLNYKDFYTIYEYVLIMVERMKACEDILNVDLNIEVTACSEISQKFYRLLLISLKSNYKEFSNNRLLNIQKQLNDYLNELKAVLFNFYNKI